MNEQLKKRLQARKKEMTDAKEIEINETHEQNQEKFEQELALRVVLYFDTVFVTRVVGSIPPPSHFFLIKRDSKRKKAI